MINITDAEAAYIAGFLDGDGNINVAYSKNRYRARGQFAVNMSIDQVDPRPVLWIHGKVGGKLCRIKDKRGGNRRDRVRWYCGSARCEALLLRLMPYLINKQEKARIALAMRESIKKSRNRPVGGVEYQRRLHLVASSKVYSL